MPRLETTTVRLGGIRPCLANRGKSVDEVSDPWLDDHPRTRSCRAGQVSTQHPRPVTNLDGATSEEAWSNGAAAVAGVFAITISVSAGTSLC